jgi:hypothetical protein
MIKILIKPLSVNSAYKGRRFVTDAHRWFKMNMRQLLPDNYKLPAPPYVIHFEFGLSSGNSDGDNCVKLAQDSIADKYGFNDRYIKRWIIDVEQVKKGHEYISFKIETLLK